MTPNFITHSWYDGVPSPENNIMLFFGILVMFPDMIYFMGWAKKRRAMDRRCQFVTLVIFWGS